MKGSCILPWYLVGGLLFTSAFAQGKPKYITTVKTSDAVPIVMEQKKPSTHPSDNGTPGAPAPYLPKYRSLGPSVDFLRHLQHCKAYTRLISDHSFIHIEGMKQQRCHVHYQLNKTQLACAFSPYALSYLTDKSAFDIAALDDKRGAITFESPAWMARYCKDVSPQTQNPVPSKLDRKKTAQNKTKTSAKHAGISGPCADVISQLKQHPEGLPLPLFRSALGDGDLEQTQSELQWNYGSTSLYVTVINGRIVGSGITNDGNDPSPKLKAANDNIQKLTLPQLMKSIGEPAKDTVSHTYRWHCGGPMNLGVTFNGGNVSENYRVYMAQPTQPTPSQKELHKVLGLGFDMGFMK